MQKNKIIVIASIIFLPVLVSAETFKSWKSLTEDGAIGLSSDIKYVYKNDVYEALIKSNKLTLREVIGLHEIDSPDENYGYYKASKQFKVLTKEIRKLLTSPDHVSGEIIGVFKADCIIEAELPGQKKLIIPMSIKEDSRFASVKVSPKLKTLILNLLSSK